MDNNYHIRKEKQLYFILPEGASGNDYVDKHKAGIIVNLYYENTACNYLQILSGVSSVADIYIITSNDRIAELAAGYGFCVIKKRNRGRDISALLIEGSKLWSKYEFACFVHDKKSKAEYVNEKAKVWIENIWDNTLKSEGYVKNILSLFKERTDIGLLTVPEPVGEKWKIWGKDLWRKDFELTRSLCGKIGLQCEIDVNVPPISIGTAFWCRTKALEKLVKFDWKYEDFPEEPMPSDGTVSHAIERIFPFVAQDAGFLTGTVMCQSYAAMQQVFYTEALGYLLSEVKELHPFKSLYGLREREKVCRFCDAHRKIFLYGCGEIGKACATFLQQKGYQIEAFVVSRFKEEEKKVCGLPVICLDDFIQNRKSEGVGIVVSVGEVLIDEVTENLKRCGMMDYIIFER